MLSMTQVKFKYVDDLATVWCEWAEMELRHKNFKRALELMRRATAPPPAAGARRTQEEIDGPVQGRLYRRCAPQSLLSPPADSALQRVGAMI